jgi:hypothetical protein
LAIEKSFGAVLGVNRKNGGQMKIWGDIEGLRVSVVIHVALVGLEIGLKNSMMRNMREPDKSELIHVTVGLISFLEKA